jgi:hypothetical protein
MWRAAIVHLLFLVGSANAQNEFQIRPAMSLTQLHESNLFSTPTDLRQDYITRLTPSVDSEFRSPRLRVEGRYTLDAEAFAEHTDLSNALARQQAAVTTVYKPTTRLSLASGFDYLTTLSPGELNAETSLTFTRARANRFGIHADVIRQLSPLTATVLGYAFTRDHLGEHFESETHGGQLGLERRMSRRDGMKFVYRFSGSRFTSNGLDAMPVDAHGLNFWWTRSLAPRISVTLGAGPRVTNGALRPEWNTSLEARFRTTTFSLGYGGTQNTVIGVVGTAEVQHVAAAAAWNPVRSFELRIAPAWFRSAVADRTAHVYALRLDAIRSITRILAVGVSVDAGRQIGQVVPLVGGNRIDRRSISIRFITRPSAREE